MKPTRAAVVSFSVALLAVTLLTLALVPEDTDRIAQVGWMILVVGVPIALGTGLMAHRAVRAVTGRDMAARLLSVATAGLRGTRAEWGAAMRSELDSIDDNRDRLRFAVGCSATAVQAGIGRRTWLIAWVTGCLVAIATLIASRVSLAGGQVGILGFTIPVPVLAVAAAGFVGARPNRSFREGVEVGAVTLMVALTMMLALEVWEGGRWYEVAGVYLTDGDPVGSGLSRVDAMLDPISPNFVLTHLLFWLPWFVIGAALGCLSRPEPTPSVQSSAPSG